MTDTEILHILNVIALLLCAISLTGVALRLRRLRWAVRGMSKAIDRLSDRMGAGK